MYYLYLLKDYLVPLLYYVCKPCARLPEHLLSYSHSHSTPTRFDKPICSFTFHPNTVAIVLRRRGSTIWATVHLGSIGNHKTIRRRLANHSMQ